MVGTSVDGGQKMNSVQYEELCRRFLATKLGIAVDRIESLRVPNPKRRDLPGYAHQIDLYWESQDGIADYINIANAKWRSSSRDKADQPDVLLLAKVRSNIAAHKAVLLTSTDFTSGAIAAAKDEGIALYVVRPGFDVSVLPANDRIRMQVKLQDLALQAPESLFHFEVIHRAFDLADTAVRPAAPQQAIVRGAVNRVATPSVNRAVGGHSNRASGPPSGRVSGPRSSPITKGSGRRD